MLTGSVGVLKIGQKPCVTVTKTSVLFKSAHQSARSSLSFISISEIKQNIANQCGGQAGPKTPVCVCVEGGRGRRGAKDPGPCTTR